jgi:hypothetical protein
LTEQQFLLSSLALFFLPLFFLNSVNLNFAASTTDHSQLDFPTSLFGYFGQCGGVWGNNQYLPITDTGGKEIKSGVQPKRKAKTKRATRLKRNH